MNFIKTFKNLSLIKKIIIVFIILAVIGVVIAVPVILTQKKSSSSYTVTSTTSPDGCKVIYWEDNYEGNESGREIISQKHINAMYTGEFLFINKEFLGGSGEKFKWKLDRTNPNYLILDYAKLNRNWYSPEEIENLKMIDSNGNQIYAANTIVFYFLHLDGTPIQSPQENIIVKKVCPTTTSATA